MRSEPAPYAVLPALDSEPLLSGYRLITCRGRGGAADIWEAEAPGGFRVALKIVPLSTRLRSGELRSLEILRSVRHPHLLSIFSAWHLGDYLIIGMELADRSLWDRFLEARAEGLCGIPRQELLGYLSAAADAIDYLNDYRHAVDERRGIGIQHGDLKPQNILLFGSYAKVGDFGMARIMDRNVVSHNGSCTLAYAPPEFFGKRIARQSDQYALAVTYCQLRGGSLPFRGTVAQITVGHLLGVPELDTLPKAERGVIAQALAKQPEERWPDCRSFISALMSIETAGGEEIPDRLLIDPSEQPWSDQDEFTGGRSDREYGSWGPSDFLPLDSGESDGSTPVFELAGAASGISGTSSEETLVFPTAPDHSGESHSSQALVAPRSDVEMRPLLNGVPAGTGRVFRRRFANAVGCAVALGLIFAVVSGRLSAVRGTSLGSRSGLVNGHEVLALRSGSPITANSPSPPSDPERRSASAVVLHLRNEVPPAAASVPQPAAGPIQSRDLLLWAASEWRPALAQMARRASSLREVSEPRVQKAVANRPGQELATVASVAVGRARRESEPAVSGHLEPARATVPKRSPDPDDEPVVLHASTHTAPAEHEARRLSAAAEEGRQSQPALRVLSDIGAVAVEKGRKALSRGLHDEAVASFTEALRVEPGNIAARKHRAAAYHLRGRYREAAADYDKVLAARSDDADACLGRARVRRLLGDAAQAERDYSEAIRLHPCPDAYFGRGCLHQDRGDYSAALADFDAALKLRPRSSAILYRRALTRYQSGDNTGAVADFSQVIRIEPAHPGAYRYRGDAYARLGDLDQAAADHETYRRLVRTAGSHDRRSAGKWELPAADPNSRHG